VVWSQKFRVQEGGGAANADAALLQETPFHAWRFCMGRENSTARFASPSDDFVILLTVEGVRDVTGITHARY